MLRRLVDYVRLPAQISGFEAAYLKRMNRIGFIFFALHVPVFALVALWNDTNPLLALALTSAVLAGPGLAYLALDNPRAISVVYGFTAMLMGGVLVHFGQGPVQIEMHFYFFALLAMLSVYGNPLVIVTAAVTVALHHLALWAWLPSSVFNYAAPIWVVLVHAAFVVLESIATCFIARSFFDNVIGLEKIVQARTSELDARNHDMRLVFNHVRQGFLTVDRALNVSSERSRVVDEWLGPMGDARKLTDWLGRRAPRTAAALALGWGEVIADIMPLELTLAQLPQSFEHAGNHYRVEYSPIVVEGQLAKVLVVISDITAEIERERLELEQRDVMQILARVGSDKSGVLEFFQEASEQVAAIAEQRPADPATQKRLIHTLKGNAMIFGVQTIARRCELFENRFDLEGVLPNATERSELSARWTTLCDSLDALLGRRTSQSIELDDAEYEAILSAVLRGEAHDHVAARIKSWRLEPTIRRLARIGEQARALAVRRGKGSISVDVQDHQLRLDSRVWAPFWSAFVHVVRNAVDHGLESESERSAQSKPRATIELCTREDKGALLIEISDDGRGIDWQRVRDKARQRGLPHATRAELVEALFADGLSTLDEANEYSGRGVGMAAVREACQARGGSVRVEDRAGGGTRVSFRFPRALEAEPLRASA